MRREFCDLLIFSSFCLGWGFLFCFVLFCVCVLGLFLVVFCLTVWLWLGCAEKDKHLILWTLVFFSLFDFFFFSLTKV